MRGDRGIDDGNSEGRVIADTAGLFYRDDGPAGGPVVVFSNSLGTDLHMWEPQVRPFAERFRVVRYDSRGHGRSDAPPGPYSLDRLGSDLLAVLDALEIERAHICGLSLGGMVALWLAIYYPERVAKAVLANTAARIGTEEMWDARISSVRAGGMHAIRDEVVARFLSAPFRTRHPEVTRWAGDMLEATSPVGYVAACGALRDADLRDVVAGIRAPSLVLTGALDEATPPAQAQDLHAAIAASELAILPGAAHLSNLERPDAFNARVLAFFDRP